MAYEGSLQKMVCPDALEKIRKKKIGFISHEGFPKKKIKYNKKKRSRLGSNQGPIG